MFLPRYPPRTLQSSARGAAEAVLEDQFQFRHPPWLIFYLILSPFKRRNTFLTQSPDLRHSNLLFHGIWRVLKQSRARCLACLPGERMDIGSKDPKAFLMMTIIQKLPPSCEENTIKRRGDICSRCYTQFGHHACGTSPQMDPNRSHIWVVNVMVA